MVVGEGKEPLAKPFAKVPMPLHTFLFHLESLGHVRTKLHLHNIKRKEDAPGRFYVEQTEAATMELKVAEADKKLKHESLGHLIDVGGLKVCKWLTISQRLQFDQKTNKIMSGYPAVYPLQPIRIKKATDDEMIRAEPNIGNQIMWSKPDQRRPWMATSCGRRLIP